MSEDLKKIITSVFSMGKGSSLSRMEMKNLLVYNLRWFGPDDAQQVIQAAMTSGLLQNDSSGMVIPTFDPDKVKVDIDYRPPSDLDMNSMVRPLFERLIEAVLETGLDKKEAIRAINRTGEERNLIFSCAAIYVGMERGADMSRFYAEVENSIRFGDG